MKQILNMKIKFCFTKKGIFCFSQQLKIFITANSLSAAQVSQNYFKNLLVYCFNLYDPHNAQLFTNTWYIKGWKVNTGDPTLCCSMASTHCCLWSGSCARRYQTLSFTLISNRHSSKSWGYGKKK